VDVAHLADWEEQLAIAAKLPEQPDRVASIHMIRRGMADVWLEREPGEAVTFVVQDRELPQMPFGYGNAPALWRLLQDVPGWQSVSVDMPLARELARCIEVSRGVLPRIHGDVYLTLAARPRRPDPPPSVRRLTRRDADLIRRAPRALQGVSFGSLEALLTEGTAAGAVLDGKLVSIAHTSGASDRYEEVGAATLEPYRERGYATACASLVIDATLGRGRIAVWRAGEEDRAALRVAEKLGFARSVRRCYVAAVAPGS
jgi:hypothetical protein